MSEQEEEGAGNGSIGEQKTQRSPRSGKAITSGPAQLVLQQRLDAARSQSMVDDVLRQDHLKAGFGGALPDLEVISQIVGNLGQASEGIQHLASDHHGGTEGKGHAFKLASQKNGRKEFCRRRQGLKGGHPTTRPGAVHGGDHPNPMLLQGLKHSSEVVRLNPDVTVGKHNDWVLCPWQSIGHIVDLVVGTPGVVAYHQCEIKQGIVKNQLLDHGYCRICGGAHRKDNLESWICLEAETFQGCIGSRFGPMEGFHDRDGRLKQNSGRLPESGKSKSSETRGEVIYDGRKSDHQRSARAEHHQGA